MYIPEHFRQADSQAMQALMRQQPLATLITRNGDEVEANHIPLLWLAGGGEYGRLQGHLPRSNKLWQQHGADQIVLAIFQGPEAYVSPSWYPSKQQHGKAVPTWNYCVVHARGLLQLREDPQWLREHLSALTAQQEQHQAVPWTLDDAPEGYIDQLARVLVGIEIVIDELEGKWKLSQNRSADDRAGVITGLATAVPNATVASDMQRLEAPKESPQ